MAVAQVSQSGIRVLVGLLALQAVVAVATLEARLGEKSSIDAQTKLVAAQDKLIAAQDQHIKAEAERLDVLTVSRKDLEARTRRNEQTTAELRRSMITFMRAIGGRKP